MPMDRSAQDWGDTPKKPRRDRNACDHVWSSFLIRVGVMTPGRVQRLLTATVEQTCSICHGTRKTMIKEPILASDTPATAAARAATNVMLRYAAMSASYGWQRNPRKR